MGWATTPYCLHCPEVPDDAEHTFFKCEHWAQHRRELEAETGKVTPDNIMELMLRGEEKWNLIAHWMLSILRMKKADLD